MSDEGNGSQLIPAIWVAMMIYSLGSLAIGIWRGDNWEIAESGSFALLLLLLALLARRAPN